MDEEKEKGGGCEGGEHQPIRLTFPRNIYICVDSIKLSCAVAIICMRGWRESQFDVMTASFVVFEFNNNATDGDHYGILTYSFFVFSTFLPHLALY